MRLIMVVILSIAFVCGCNGKMDQYEKLRVTFPNGEIASLPSDNNDVYEGYIIRSSNEVWYAESYGEGHLKYTKIFTAKPE